MLFFSALAAIVPMLIYLLAIWKFDRYDREPIRLVLLNYFWGAVGAVFLTLLFGEIIFKILATLFPNLYLSDLLNTIIYSPIIEEIMKGLFLFVTVQNKKFDNITDGIVYGAAIGLGFGMTENFLYFVQSINSFETWAYLIIVRTFFSAVMHGVTTGAFGAFIGYAKFKQGPKRILLTFLGLLAAISIHVSWNSSVSFQLTHWIGIVLMIFFTVIFIIAFSISLNKEKQIIFSELLEESQNGLIPFEHVSILNSPLRNHSGWIDDSVRKIYVSSAIKLAFKKWEFKSSFGITKNYFEAELDDLRKKIEILLRKN